MEDELTKGSKFVLETKLLQEWIFLKKQKN
jgi:hypothetical protein